jgi:hypothetical protein
LYDWSEHAVTVVYSTAEEHFAVAQMVALVKKYPFDWKIISDQSPTEAAIKTFLAAEQKCGKLNRLFLSRRIFKTPYIHNLEYMRRWILHVLGSKPNLGDIYSECNFGPGANLGVHGNATNLYRKLFSEKGWTVSQAAVPYALNALRDNYNLILHLYPSVGDTGIVCFDQDEVRSTLLQNMHTVSYNSISFVPKTAKTDRSIAVEPLLNSFLQLGVDKVLRKKLCKHGYDLKDQERNKVLARLGSIDGSLATVDLSSASDSISYELVRFLLPTEWFLLLDSLRSGAYKLGGVVSTYEKFCSMGNGFCFPLETLIFAAAARAAIHEVNCGRCHAVYGDDIILPTEAFKSIERILGVCGFSVNRRKSFSDGPFRESCGADWYRGQDVRPVYLDDPLCDNVTLRIFHNSTLRSDKTKTFFEGIRQYLRDQVPVTRQFMRPDFMGSREVPFKGLPKDLLRVLTANQNGAFDVPLDIYMGSRWSKWNTALQQWSWREELFTSRKDKGHCDLFRRAQYLAFLSGTTGGELALRRLTRTSIRRIN